MNFRIEYVPSTTNATEKPDAKSELYAMTRLAESRAKRISELEEQTLCVREKNVELKKALDEKNALIADYEAGIAETDEILTAIEDTAEKLKEKIEEMSGWTYAEKLKAKYDSLVQAGFTEDQAMSLIPLWTE